MPSVTLAELLLRRHEGVRTVVYDDATGEPIVSGTLVVGNPTIGVGRNLAARGLSRPEISLLLQNDLDIAYHIAEDWLGRENWSLLDTVRQAAILDMAVNLGSTRLLGFVKLRQAIQNKDWEKASAEMLDSLWAKQVKGRAVELAEMVRTGEVPPDAI